jgi:hypothetical protein
MKRFLHDFLIGCLNAHALRQSLWGGIWVGKLAKLEPREARKSEKLSIAELQK